MKKLITFIFIIQSILLGIIGLHSYENYKYDELIYKGKSSVLIIFDTERKYSHNAEQYLLEIYKKYKVNISKYVFASNDTINIYTTDPSMGNVIYLNAGIFPKNNTKEFISNKNRVQEQQTGTFDYYIKNKNINIFPITQKENMGMEGLYYFNTIDKDLLNTILEDINENMATAEIYSIYGVDYGAFLSYVLDNSVLLILFGLTSLLLYMSFIHYILQNSKRFAILKLHGYSNISCIQNIIYKLLPFFTVGFLFSAISVTIKELIQLKFRNMSNIVSIIFIVCIINLVVSIILFCFFTFFQLTKNNIAQKIKGKKSFKLVFTLHFILKYVFLIYMLISLLNLTDVLKNLNTQYNSLTSWDKAKNIYTTTLKYTGQSRETERKMKQIYLEMKKTSGFIIDATNFFEVYEDTPLYKLNTSGQAMYYDANGKSIVIDENYLKKNPITINGNEREVFQQIKYKENCRNILVPKSFQVYEKEITESYLKYFYFQKVEVSNLYNKELNLPLNLTKKEALELNIIYVDDNQDYFTFSSIAEKNNCNIKDPIAIIETGNIDDSYYNSYISKCFYFETDDIDAYGSIVSIISKYDATSNIQKVVSIYDEKGKYIQELQAERIYLISTIYITGFILIIVIYFLTTTYYYQNKYKLYIKKTFGYAMLARIKGYISTIFIIDSIIIILTAFLNNSRFLFSIGIVIILWDVILCYCYSWYLDHRIFHTILKGEH